MVYLDDPVETPGPKKCIIENIWSIGGCDDFHVIELFEGPLWCIDGETLLAEAADADAGPSMPPSVSWLRGAPDEEPK